MANPALIERAWKTLVESYPTFKDRFGREVNDTWRMKLDKLTDDQLRHGLNAVVEGDFPRMPDVGAFVKVCREVAGQEVQAFRNPIPALKRPCDKNGKELPWWAYIHPARAKPFITEASVQTFLMLKKQNFPDQEWLVTGGDG